MNEGRYREAERQLWEHYGATPMETWLDLEKPATKIRVLEVGEGEPVLFVHGGPGAATVFAPLAAHMTGVRCILLDRPGCGLSPALDYSSLATGLADLAANIIHSAIDALGLDRADIVANSFGGSCAIWLAQRHRERVAKIAFVGCPAFLSQMQMSTFLRLLAAPGIGFLAARLPATKIGTMSFMRSMGERKLIEEGRLPEEFVDWWISLGRDTRTMQNEREGVRLGFTWRGMQPQSVIKDEALRGLDHRQYFYWGTDDTFTSAKAGTQLVGTMSDATIDVVPAGHLPWFDDPADASARVRAFLRGENTDQPAKSPQGTPAT